MRVCSCKKFSLLRSTKGTGLGKRGRGRELGGKSRSAPWRRGPSTTRRGRWGRSPGRAGSGGECLAAGGPARRWAPFTSSWAPGPVCVWGGGGGGRVESCAARALRRGPGLLSEPGSRSTLIAGVFLSISARWHCTDCPPGRLNLDRLLSLPRETLTSPGQGKDILPSLGELAAAG